MIWEIKKRSLLPDRILFVGKVEGGEERRLRILGVALARWDLAMGANKEGLLGCRAVMPKEHRHNLGYQW